MKQATKKLTFDPTNNQRLKRKFKEFNITFAVQNEFNIKTLTTADHKEKEPSYRKSGIYSKLLKL